MVLLFSLQLRSIVDQSLQDPRLMKLGFNYVQQVLYFGAPLFSIPLSADFYMSSSYWAFSEGIILININHARDAGSTLESKPFVEEMLLVHKMPVFTLAAKSGTLLKHQNPSFHNP